MYFLFLFLWIVFNGKVTAEVIIFGLIIAAVMYLFICRFMEYNPKTDIYLLKRIFHILRYIGILIKEIIKANFTAMHLLFSAKYTVEPVLVRFKTTLKSRTAKVLLANSITLTPGTITVSLEEDEFVVHCLDKSLADGLSDGIFVIELERMEKVD